MRCFICPADLAVSRNVHCLAPCYQGHTYDLQLLHCAALNTGTCTRECLRADWMNEAHATGRLPLPPDLGFRVVWKQIRCASDSYVDGWSCRLGHMPVPTFVQVLPPVSVTISHLLLLGKTLQSERRSGHHLYERLLQTSCAGPKHPVGLPDCQPCAMRPIVLRLCEACPAITCWLTAVICCCKLPFWGPLFEPACLFRPGGPADDFLLLAGLTCWRAAP